MAGSLTLDQNVHTALQTDHARAAEQEAALPTARLLWQHYLGGNCDINHGKCAVWCHVERQLREQVVGLGLLEEHVGEPQILYQQALPCTVVMGKELRCGILCLLPAWDEVPLVLPHAEFLGASESFHWHYENNAHRLV